MTQPLFDLDQFIQAAGMTGYVTALFRAKFLSEADQLGSSSGRPRTCIAL